MSTEDQVYNEINKDNGVYTAHFKAFKAIYKPPKLRNLTHLNSGTQEKTQDSKKPPGAAGSRRNNI